MNSTRHTSEAPPLYTDMITNMSTNMKSNMHTGAKRTERGNLFTKT